MKSLGTNVTRAGIVSGLHKATYKGLTKTVHFQSNGNIAGNVRLHLQGEERQDRRRRLGPLTLAHKQDK